MVELPHRHGTLPKEINAHMPNGDTFDAVSDILKLMCDSNRIRIFWILCHGEECVANLSALLGVSSPTSSHHLKILKAAGLVISRREGKEVYYAAANTPRTSVLHSMIEQIIDVACPAEEAFEESRAYDSAVQTVNEVHAVLTGDLKRRYTVSELASAYHINPTTLKATFKTVFGQPIGTYMKNLRIEMAKKLLMQSDMPISDISAEVGYGNSGKFSAAFKSVVGMLPKEYRRFVKNK